MSLIRRFDPERATVAAETLENLPKILLTARARGGKSLRGAATEIGCTHTMLSRLEGGRLPNGDMLILILRWIGEGK